MFSDNVLHSLALAAELLELLQVKHALLALADEKFVHIAFDVLSQLFERRQKPTLHKVEEILLHSILKEEAVHVG